MKACLHDLSERWEGPSEARSPDCQSLPTAEEGGRAARAGLGGPFIREEVIGTGDADDAVGGAEGIEETVVGSAHDDKAAKGTVDDEGVP